MNKKIRLLVGLLLMSSALVMADEDEIELSDVEDKYSSSLEIEAGDELKQSINIGFSNITGDTDTLHLNGKYEMAFATVGYDAQVLKVGFDTSVFFSESNDIRDNEEYTANLGLEQTIINGWLGYFSLNWLRDKFRNFEYKTTIGTGIGKELLKDGAHSLKLKLGIAYNIEEYFTEQENHKYTSLNEYIEYNNQLNKTSKLYVKLGISENFDDFQDYEVLAVAGFNFSVAENLSVTMEGEVSYDKIPPVGFDTTNTKTIIRVGYDF